VTRLGIALIALIAACGPPPSPRGEPVPAPPPPRPASGGEHRHLPRAPHGRSPREEAVERSVHAALGVPTDADPSDDYLMDKEQYVVSYNPRYNAPNWAAWNLDRRHLGRAPRTPGFRSDDQLPAGVYVVKDVDYTGSGYDRGHLCPSADRSASPEINRTTFVLTNVQPQLHELNAGPWEKLEEHERELAKRGKELYIVAGGVFDASPKRIGRERDDAHRVAVPRASYKVIVALDPGQGPDAVRADTEVVSVVMPNAPDVKDHAWTDYVVSVREIERETGYDFLTRVPKDVQDVIERRGEARAAHDARDAHDAR
jgi:endonuclease G